MNFHIVDGVYADLDSIYDDFCEDYLYSNELSNVEIRKKYGLTVSEFNEFAKTVKDEHGLTRRPRLCDVHAKHYYKHTTGFSIRKHIDGTYWYFGVVPTHEIAEIIVQKCIEAKWDIETCYKLVKNWRKYIGS